MQARCGGLAGRGHLPENRNRSWRTVECGTKYSRFVKPGRLKQIKSRTAELSTRPLAKIPRGDTPPATAGSWDRAAYRSWDRLNTGSRPSPGGRSSPPQQTPCRNCRRPETFSKARRLWIFWIEWSPSRRCCDLFCIYRFRFLVYTCGGS